MIAICSNRPRPSVHTGNKNAAWGWQRDVYHLRDEAVKPVGYTVKTLCGISATGWLTIGTMETLDGHCCERCRLKQGTQRISPSACIDGWTPTRLEVTLPTG